MKSSFISIVAAIAIFPMAAAGRAGAAEAEVDFAKIPDVRIFKGDETVGYRDPAAWYEDGVGKYVMFFHGSGPKKEIEGDCYKNSSLGIAWSDDLEEWTWPGKPCKQTR